MTCSLDKFPKSIFFIVGFTLNPPFATIEYAVAKCNGVAEIPCPNDIVIVEVSDQFFGICGFVRLASPSSTGTASKKPKSFKVFF